MFSMPNTRTIHNDRVSAEDVQRRDLLWALADLFDEDDDNDTERNIDIAIKVFQSLDPGQAEYVAWYFESVINTIWEVKLSGMKCKSNASTRRQKCSAK